MDKIQLDYCPSKYMYCHKSNKSLEVHWQRDVPGREVDHCLDIIRSLVNITPAKDLLIDGLEMKSSDFGLNWRIIERTWKTFYENGGERIVIMNKKKLPQYVHDEYAAAIKKYDIPLKIEFFEAYK
jgi:hypothetical protein